MGEPALAVLRESGGKGRVLHGCCAAPGALREPEGARNGLGGMVLVGRGIIPVVEVFRWQDGGVVFLRFTCPSDSSCRGIVFRNKAC